MLAKDKRRIELVVHKETLKAWRAAADQSGLNLSAWIRLRCSGIDMTAAAPIGVQKAA